MLEIVNRVDIPVYQGADMPLVHEKSDFATRGCGKWYSSESPEMPPGGFATKQVEDEAATSLIVKTVLSRPQEVTLIAIGPLSKSS